MKFHVNFQEMGKNGRPIDHASTADFQTADGGSAIIPNVGDYVHIEPTATVGAPRYYGKVKSRLFSYIGESCHINIVVDSSNDDDWGALIKE